MQSLATSQVTDHLLANRELLSLERASLFLGTHLRTRTPLGAWEFLVLKTAHDQEAYDARVSIALECMEIYRTFFPAEYERSVAPYLSTQREHEFYRLIHTRLFPLHVHEDGDLIEEIDRDPTVFLPYIPMGGIQKHTWEGGCFDFWEIELCFRLAQVLSWNTGAGGAGWQALSLHYGLHAVSAPASPLAAVGWNLFAHSCHVEETPLKYLPLCFQMIGYRTGNPWLDLPRIGCLGIKWSPQQVANLLTMRLKASDCEIAIKALDIWLEEDPQRGIARAVELWNDAARKEEESGYGGMMVEDLVEAGGIPLGDDLVMMPPTARQVLEGHLLQLEEGEL